jgi:hypothetical protein
MAVHGKAGAFSQEAKVYLISDFNRELGHNALQWVNHGYGAISAELQAIATALSSDTTKHGPTIEKPAAALTIGPSHTYYTNDALRLVNKGKDGGLTPTALSNAITAALGTVLPPANTTAPLVSGTGTVGQTLTCTQGIWTLSPTAYAYQWLRSGAKITGAEASTHVLITSDSGHNISCRVTASTTAGSTSADSNAVACA